MDGVGSCWPPSAALTQENSLALGWHQGHRPSPVSASANWQGHKFSTRTPQKQPKSETSVCLPRMHVGPEQVQGIFWKSSCIPEDATRMAIGASQSQPRLSAPLHPTPTRTPLPGEHGTAGSRAFYPDDASLGQLLRERMLSFLLMILSFQIMRSALFPGHFLWPRSRNRLSKRACGTCPVAAEWPTLFLLSRGGRLGRGAGIYPMCLESSSSPCQPARLLC